MRNNCRLTVCELANKTTISIGSCHEMLIKNLQMRGIAVKFVRDCRHWNKGISFNDLPRT